MIAQALPKTQELSDRINTLFLKKRKPSEFDIHLLKKEAEKLNGKIEFANYYAIFGQIATLENDRENIVSYYKNAIKLSPNDYYIQKNYFVCLKNTGLVFKAEEQARNLVENYSNKETWSYFVSNTFNSCQFNKALQLLDTLKISDEAFHNLLISIIAIFEIYGLSDDEAQRLCKLAYSSLETKKLFFSGSNIEVIDNCILYTIYVDLPIGEIFDVNWELAGVFAENVDNMRSDVLMFEYSSVDVLEEKENHERLI